MKVAIDTRYDTLEEALAVVALAFEASAKGATKKPKRADKNASSRRRPGRKRAAPGEPKSGRHSDRSGQPEQDDRLEASYGNQEERCPKGNSREERHDDGATQEVDGPPAGGDSAGPLRDHCQAGHRNDGGSIEGSGDTNGLEERERQRQREREDEEG